MMIILFIFILLTITPKAYAETLQNGNYSIDSYGINLQNKASKQTSSVETHLPGVFVHLEGEAPFTFSLSSLFVNFGELSPTNPTTRTSKVTIVPSSTVGYSLQVLEEKELVSPHGSIIPDTTCDSGACNAHSSATWESLLSFGLGYRCDNIQGGACVNDFQNTMLFKALANKAKGQLPVVVMESQDNKKSIGEITYKVNISTTKDIGTYKNKINYIAIPNF